VVHGLFRAAANGTDSRLFHRSACDFALAASLANPRLVRPCRSPDWTCEISSIIAVFSSTLLWKVRAGPRELRSTPEFLFQIPRSVVSDPLSWDSSRLRFCRRHCCRSVGLQPDPATPPSTCSPASTPASASLPSLRSRSATFTIPFRPHRFARSRRFSPPIAPFARSFAPSLAQDSRACCIPLPILGFAAFLSSIGWFHLPTPAVSGRCADGHANAASPQRVSYPSEDSPHPQPFRVSTIVAPMVFASREVPIDPSPPLPAPTHVSRLHDAPPSRRCSADGSVPVCAVSSARPAYPPWALFPFEVLRPRDCSRGGCFAHAVRRHPSERNPCSFAAALVVPSAETGG